MPFVRQSQGVKPTTKGLTMKERLLLKTLQKLCELNKENEQLKREIKIYKELFIKEVMNEF